MDNPEQIDRYFPALTPAQTQQFSALAPLYTEWNKKINVISRKDIDQLYTRHILHSLGVAKVIEFKAGSTVLDVGTGGGFPGIPLAILFPAVQFHLIDAIGKKTRVAAAIAKALQLDNVIVSHTRAENVSGQYDFVVSRAVTRLQAFLPWVRHNIAPKQAHAIPNGLLALKGGDLEEELLEANRPYELFRLSKVFDDPFFETKQVVIVPLPHVPPLRRKKNK